MLDLRGSRPRVATCNTCNEFFAKQSCKALQSLLRINSDGTRCSGPLISKKQQDALEAAFQNADLTLAAKSLWQDKKSKQRLKEVKCTAVRCASIFMFLQHGPRRFMLLCSEVPFVWERPEIIRGKAARLGFLKDHWPYNLEDTWPYFESLKDLPFDFSGVFFICRWGIDLAAGFVLQVEGPWKCQLRIFPVFGFSFSALSQAASAARDVLLLGGKSLSLSRCPLEQRPK